MVFPVPTVSYLRRRVPHALLASGIILLLIAFVPLLAVHSISLPPRSGKTLDEFTFVGDAYPSYYPIDLGQVSFTPEDTVHYQIYAEDAESEWNSVFPDGGGFLALGPEQRIFGLSLFHQMHCLVRIRRAISTRQPSGHAYHCINYLRQIVLCEADTTLEPVVSNVGRGGVYSETGRTCQDWSRVYDLAAENNQTMRRRAYEPGPNPTYI